jgi:hypothetical protein
VEPGHECYVQKVEQENTSLFLGARFHTNAKKKNNLKIYIWHSTGAASTHVCQIIN